VQAMRQIVPVPVLDFQAESVLVRMHVFNPAV